MVPLPTASDLALTPGEESPAVAKIHGEVLAALANLDLPAAQRLTADLIDLIETQRGREPGEKSRRLIDFVVLLS